MRYVLLTALTAMLMAGATPGRAEPDGESGTGKMRAEAEQALREGTRKIIEGIELMLKSVPQYDLPKVNEFGDIIIQRRNPTRPRPPEDGPDESQT